MSSLATSGMWKCQEASFQVLYRSALSDIEIVVAIDRPLLHQGLTGRSSPTCLRTYRTLQTIEVLEKLLQ